MISIEVYQDQIHVRLSHLAPSNFEKKLKEFHVALPVARWDAGIRKWILSEKEIKRLTDFAYSQFDKSLIAIQIESEPFAR